MFRYRYRQGIGRPESELLRGLRRKGFAIVVIPPAQVGHPLNRKTIEDRMLKAALTSPREEGFAR